MSLLSAGVICAGERGVQKDERKWLLDKGEIVSHSYIHECVFHFENLYDNLEKRKTKPH